MVRLGYDQYVTQGGQTFLFPCQSSENLTEGNWGNYIARAISLLYPQHCKATHFNTDVGSKPNFFKTPLIAIEAAFRPLNAREKQGIERTEWFDKEGLGYNLLQSTKPQTLGYGRLSRHPPVLDLRETPRLDGLLLVDRRGNLHVGQHLLVQHG
jgi:hypothetical protein